MGRAHRLTRRRRSIERVYWVTRLWQLAESLESYPHPLASLDLSGQVWFHGRCPTVEEVVKHYERVLAADLDYPILLDFDGRVMDGYHRIVKARLQGDTTILAVRFPVTPEADELRWVEGHPSPVGIVAEFVSAARLDLHRELDRTRVALARRLPAEQAQAWSDRVLQFLDSVEEQLTSWSHGVRIADRQPISAARTLRALNALRDTWFFDARFPDLIALAEADQEPIRIGSMLLTMVERLHGLIAEEEV